MYIYDTSKSSPPVQVYNDAPTGTVRQQIAVVQDPYVVFDNQDELYVWDKSSRSVSRLTDNDYMEQAPLIDGSRVAWSARGGADVYTATLRKSASALALAAPATVNYGSSAKVWGTLKSGSSALAGRKIALEYSSNNSTWKSWKTVTTNSSGVFAAYAKPARKTFYRAKFTGDAAYAPRPRPPSGCSRVYLSKPSGPQSITHGVAFNSPGTSSRATPRAPSRCGSSATGKCRASTGSRRPTTPRSRTTRLLEVQGIGEAPGRGSWRIRAYYPTTTTNYKKVSTWRYITAK